MSALAVEVAYDGALAADDVASAAAAIRGALAPLLADHDAAALALTVVLVDDARMAELHQRFSGVEGPTDSLAFAADDDEPEALGESYVGLDVAARQAARLGHALADEATLYAVHGALHLLGYDDGDDASRAAMRAAERRYAGLDGGDEAD